jgi:uncharacterized protein YwbE
MFSGDVAINTQRCGKICSGAVKNLAGMSNTHEQHIRLTKYMADLSDPSLD